MNDRVVVGDSAAALAMVKHLQKKYGDRTFAIAAAVHTITQMMQAGYHHITDHAKHERERAAGKAAADAAASALTFLAKQCAETLDVSDDAVHKCFRELDKFGDEMIAEAKNEDPIQEADGGQVTAAMSTVQELLQRAARPDQKPLQSDKPAE